MNDRPNDRTYSKVHISEKTLDFLNGEFEVKDGDGASREEAIRIAGVKTYLIVSVLKPWPEGTLDEHGPDNVEDEEWKEAESAQSAVIMGPGGEIVNVVEYNRRLRFELLNRDCEKNLSKHCRPLTASFLDAQYEHQYRYTRDVTSCVSLLGLPLTLLSCFVVYLLLEPVRLATLLVITLSNGVLLTMALVCTAPTLCNVSTLLHVSIQMGHDCLLFSLPAVMACFGRVGSLHKVLRCQ